MNIVFVFATENYPYSFSANNTKISMIAEELVNLNHQVTIINNYKSAKETFDIKLNGVEVISDSINPFRTLCNVLKHKRNKNSNILILSYNTIPNQYRVLRIGKRLSYKVGYIYQEWHLGLENTIKGKLNATALSFNL